jgi:superfamily II RNA helicase
MHSTIGAPWVGAPWTPRAWQREALPIIIDALKRRQRGIVSAVMGSGKSIMQSELVALALAKAGHRSIVVTVPRQALVRQLAATIGARIGEDRVGVFYGSEEAAGPAGGGVLQCLAPPAVGRTPELPERGRPDDLRRGPRHPGRGAA